MFQGKDMCLIMNMKLGQIYNRWMGTLTQSTKTSKCVVFSTLNDQMLISRKIHWDKYVKRMLDLPKSKSLLDILGICIDDTHLYLVHEYVVCETLETRIEARRDGGSYYVTSLWQSEVKSHLMNLLEGMEIIHSYGLLHPGLTAGKILVTNRGICKLYDFCLPQDATSKLMILKSQGKHFVRQLPPESLLRNEYLQESDVWSFATVVWNLVSKESVEAIEDNEMISMEESIASLSEKWPAEFCHLRNPNLFRCWMFNSSLRPSMNSLRKSFMEILSFKTTSSLSETLSDSQSDLYLPMKGPSNSKVIETDF
ncbi:Fibroblast growth factor receptor 2 [Holothuria leucospilota]|uniref:Fibroblast growth factor receptor 2 n=1 Tax=Holothuria leucospilota TaxID=206669 RepID=A0A9Q1CNQ4_HOLLE|nr:Fibroblast growth factor receptor 2 [Holothuria leucospilota]